MSLVAEQWQRNKTSLEIKSMSDIPVLDTARLLLCAPEMKDWPAYCAMMQSDHSRFMGGPLEEDHIWGIFCHDVASWHLMGHGALMIEDKASGHCVGQVSLNAGPLFPELELGWFLYEGWEGKGYAFEGALCLRDWAFDQLKLTSFVSYMHPDNDRSINLAQKLSGRLDETAVRLDPIDLAYRYSRA